MYRKIISIVLTAIFLVSMVPAVSAQNDVILLSEDFSSYANNETNIFSVKAVSGIDTRVISDGGEKVLFSRAFGSRIYLKSDIPSSKSTKTVMSASVKHEGKITKGKLFSAVYKSGKIDFLNLYEDGTLRLPGGKIIDGIPRGRYRTITIKVDWQAKTYDVYMDKKCVISEWMLPSGSFKSAPDTLEWQINFDPAEETGFYMDNLRVYDGDELPWERSFPVQKFNNDSLDFTPTTEIDNSVKVVKNLEFDTDSLGVNVVYNGGSMAASKDEEGTSCVRMSADEATPSTSYFDIVDETLASMSNYVVEARFKIVDISGDAHLRFFDTKDSEYGTWRTGYKVVSSGAMNSVAASIPVGTSPVGEWTRLSIIYDLNEFSAAVYVNGEYVASHSVTNDYFPTIFRVDHRNSEGNVNETLVDWVRIYSGDRLLDDEFFVSDSSGNKEVDLSASVMDPADKLSNALSGTTVFMPSNSTACINGKKITLATDSEKLIYSDGSLMIPADTFTAFSGEEVVYDAASGEVKIGDKAVLNVGKNECIVSDTVQTLTPAPINKGNIVYLPLRDMCEKVLGKVLTWDQRGFAMIASSAVPLTQGHHYVDHYEQWHPVDLIYRFMQFEFPSGKEMINAVIKNHPDKSHPRMWYTSEDIEHIHKRIAEDDTWKKAYKTAVSEAQQYVYRDFSSYYNAADSAKQGAAFDFQGAMESLALAYILTGDHIYADKGIEMMKGFCSWDRLAYQNGHLVIGHWAAGIAIGYDVFYNYMMSTEAGRADLAHIRQVAAKICFADHVTAYQNGTGPVWPTLQDNFVGVIGGGMMSLLLTLCDEDDISYPMDYLLENVMKSMYIATELYWPDGGYFEGVAYTEYHLRNILLGAIALQNTCGTDYSMSKATGFENAGAFLNYMQTPNSSFAFHDSDNKYYNNNQREVMAYLYNRPNDAYLSQLQKRLGGHSFDISSLLHFEKATANSGVKLDLSDVALDAYYVGSDTGTMRNSFALSNPVFAAFHAGRTNIPHDMLDLGQFVFESDGVVWAMDLGRDSYGLPAYFAKDGYRIYRKRPEGENCVVINPAEDSGKYFGQELDVYVPLRDAELNKPYGAKASYDLTAAYQRDVNSYVRGYYFGDNRNTFTVQDEMKLKSTSELYWFMHTPAEIEIISNTKAKLTKDGKTLIADVYCSEPGYTLKAMAPEPLPDSPKVEGQNANIGITKLAIHCPSASGDAVISVKLSPQNGNYEYAEPTLVPIDKWTIPDSAPAVIAEFDSICSDGKLIDGFIPTATKYTVDVPFGTTKAPIITASSSMGHIVINQAETIEDVTKVILQRDGYPDTVCMIEYNEVVDRDIVVTDELSDAKPIAGTPDGLITPVSIFGLTLPEPENPPERMIDGDFGTRATQNGSNLWFEFDMGEVIDISGLAISFYSGSSRTSKFDILYSEDGTNFKRVFSGDSSGTTDEFETLAIPGKVRYIRYVGFGNSQHAWNSITEFRAYR